MARTSNPEIRNPKSERNLKDKSPKSETVGRACFVFSSSLFGFLSDFGFQISDLAFFRIAS
ncbi:MAG TPA: hypothetical protein VH575_06180, partial [Gemmataceae bacterium]